MRTGFSKLSGRHRFAAMAMALAICAGQFFMYAEAPEIKTVSDITHIYDISAARAYCDNSPLEDPEGIWIYPDDRVTVLITRRPDLSQSSLPGYDIRVVDSSDIRLRPGDVIGSLASTPERKKFEASLFTERGPAGLLKPKTVLALLSDEGETMVLKKEKPRFSFRFTLNPSTLLPRLWRIIRINTSSGNSASTQSPSVGMVKIYPSYDGNGSYRRRPRYL